MIRVDDDLVSLSCTYIIDALNLLDTPSSWEVSALTSSDVGCWVMGRAMLPETRSVSAKVEMSEGMAQDVYSVVRSGR